MQRIGHHCSAVGAHPATQEQHCGELLCIQHLSCIKCCCCTSSTSVALCADGAHPANQLHYVLLGRIPKITFHAGCRHTHFLQGVAWMVRPKWLHRPHNPHREGHLSRVGVEGVFPLATLQRTLHRRSASSVPLASRRSSPQVGHHPLREPMPPCGKLPQRAIAECCK